MHLRIWHKLFLSFLAATSIVVVIALVLTRYSFHRGFIDYMNQLENQRLDALATELIAHYEQSNSWDVYAEDESLWRDALRQTFAEPGRRFRGRRPRGNGKAPPRNQGPPPNEGPPRAELPRQSMRIDLLAANGDLVRGRGADRASSKRYPITVADRTIGYLRYVPVSSIAELRERADQQFVRGQSRSLWSIAVLALGVAAALALLMARQLVAPVRALNRGAKAIAQGDLDQRIDVRSNDELGQLATDFNAMARSLGQMRTARRQWIVDISHELRTPLAILGGELQALEDGVRNWDDGARQSLQAEVTRLSRLVGDLHELSVSDAGGMSYDLQPLDLRPVVESAIDACRTRIAERNLTLQIDLPPLPMTVSGDARRLTQMLINLLENSVRYTDLGGTLRVAGSVDQAVQLIVEDSAPGVSEDALPRLFDRLYRVEASRNRGTGGSGLGLAICQAVVAAHGGDIRATASPLGGLRIEVELPHEH
ncbi:MAG: ATP-binding protein [Gammaproteobacteria bacterium]